MRPYGLASSRLIGVEVLRVQRAQGRKPARGENLHLVGAEELIKVNSLEGIRILTRGD